MRSVIKNPPTILLVAATTAIVPRIAAVFDLCSPAKTIAPTTAIASSALVNDISGVCNSGETCLITSNPINPASIKINKLSSKFPDIQPPRYLRIPCRGAASCVPACPSVTKLTPVLSQSYIAIRQAPLADSRHRPRLQAPATCNAGSAKNSLTREFTISPSRVSSVSRTISSARLHSSFPPLTKCNKNAEIFRAYIWLA